MAMTVYNREIGHASTGLQNSPFLFPHRGRCRSKKRKYTQRTKHPRVHTHAQASNSKRLFPIPLSVCTPWIIFFVCQHLGSQCSALYPNVTNSLCITGNYLLRSKCEFFFSSQNIFRFAVFRIHQ